VNAGVFNSLSRPAIEKLDLSICQGLLNNEYLTGTSMFMTYQNC
jgi:hypothetical protein